MTLEFKIEGLLQDIQETEQELNLKYKKLAVLRAELDRERHDSIRPHLVTTASD